MPTSNANVNANAAPAAPSTAAWWRQVPTGWWVLIVLLLLLQGPSGAAAALVDQLHQFVAGLLGGEATMRGVVYQTAPLALAAAAISFGCRAGWVTWDNHWSLLTAAAILAVSGPIGIELRSLYEARAAEQTAAADTPWRPRPVSPLASTATELSAWQALGELTTWRALTEVHPDRVWRRGAPTVRLFPERSRPSGVARFWVAAVEQTLSYLLVYRPRLFLAAVVAGAYLGWQWHRRLTILRRHFSTPDATAAVAPVAADDTGRRAA